MDFARTLASHGVATLPPQRVDPVGRILETTVVLGTGRARNVALRSTRSGEVAIECQGRRLGATDTVTVVALVRLVLGLDQDLSQFYVRAASDPALAWATMGAGRMLRAPTVFEDVVKTICTTNCAWSATIRMVTSIVNELGVPAPDGRRAFPGPAAMAAAGEEFYREVARAGYRGAYLLRLAGEIAQGNLDLESLRDDTLPDDEVTKRLLALPGVGPYGAAHVMLVSLGRCSRPVLDSWTRPTYAKRVGRPTSDRAIERRFRRFGAYAGLAFWLFVTEDWMHD